MARKEIKAIFNDNELNKMNSNFKELYDEFGNVVDKVSNKAYAQIVDSAKLNWKEPVDSVGKLPANAFVGDTRMTRDTGKVYRNDGSTWHEIQQIDAGPVNEVDSRLSSQLADIAINVKNFGAKGDRVTDDREAIQNAIDYLETQGGGTLFFPYTENGYSIQSAHPEHPGSGLVIKSNNINLTSINHTQIWADVEMDKLIHYVDPGVRLHSFSIKSIRLEGMQNCNVGIYSDDYIFRTSFDDLYVHNFKDKGMDANVFTAKFNRCIFRQNKNIGIDLNDQTMPGTSVVFIDTNCSENEIGYKLTYVNYSTFISSFGEYSNIVFDIEDCNTLTFVGCGVEHIKQAMRVKRGSGVEVGSFYMGEMGYSGEAPNKYIFEFDNISGGYFGGANRQETLYDNSKMVGFIDCRDMSMKLGRIMRQRDQVDFIRSQVTVLGDVNRTTTGVTYYVNPNTGSNYSDYDYHGTSSEKPFASWWRLLEALPKNIDHVINVNIDGNLSEQIELNGFSVSGRLQINCNNRNIDSLSIKGCVGDIYVHEGIFNSLNIHQSQGMRIMNNEINEFEIRYSSGIFAEYNIVNVIAWFRSASTVQFMDNTGSGDIRVDGSIAMVHRDEPTGSKIENYGGRIMRTQ